MIISKNRIYFNFGKSLQITFNITNADEEIYKNLYDNDKQDPKLDVLFECMKKVWCRNPDLFLRDMNYYAKHSNFILNFLKELGGCNIPIQISPKRKNKFIDLTIDFM